MNTAPESLRSQRIRGAASILLALGILLATPESRAQSGPATVVTQHQLQVVDMRLERVERLLDSGVLTEMLQGMDELQAEVRQLRGRVEQMENDLRNLQTRQRDQFRNLDERLALIEGDTTARRPPEPDPLLDPDEPLPDADEQGAYEAAFDVLMGGDYGQAIARLEQFMERYPDGVYSANALYWLAEAKYASGEYEGALVDFEAVRARFPDSDKAADSLLKIGYSQFELGDAAAAREALEAVVAGYPGTTLSRLAQDRLRRLDGR